MSGDPVIIYALTGLLTIGGLLLIVPGVVMLKRRIGALKHGGIIDSVIIHWEEMVMSPSRSSSTNRLRSRTMYTPHVRYTANTGDFHECKLDYSFDDLYRAMNPVGTMHRVRYDPAGPGRIYEPTTHAMFLAPGMLTLAGGLMLLIALGMLFG